MPRPAHLDADQSPLISRTGPGRDPRLEFLRGVGSRRRIGRLRLVLSAQTLAARQDGPRQGSVRVMTMSRESPYPEDQSGGGGRSRPRPMRLGRKEAECRWTDQQMRVFRPIVPSHPTWPMAILKAKITGSGAIRCPFAGDDRFWVDTLILQKCPKLPMCCALIATLLDRHVEDLAFVVDGAPEKHPLAADLHDHLIEAPMTGGPWPPRP